MNNPTAPKFRSFEPFDKSDVDALLQISYDADKDPLPSITTDPASKILNLAVVLSFLIVKCLEHGGKFGLETESHYIGLFYKAQDNRWVWDAPSPSPSVKSTFLFWFKVVDDATGFRDEPGVTDALGVLYGIPPQL